MLRDGAKTSYVNTGQWWFTMQPESCRNKSSESVPLMSRRLNSLSDPNIIITHIERRRQQTSNCMNRKQV